MKQFILVALIFLLNAIHAFATETDLFPLKKMAVGMRSSELLKTYPKGTSLFVKTNKTGGVTEALTVFRIEGNKYWDSAAVVVKDSKVMSVGYCRVKNSGQVRTNIGSIYKALEDTLGRTPQKMVVHHLVGRGKRRSPMFVWNMDNGVAAFTHMPLKDYVQSKPFICTLTVAPSVEALQTTHDVAKDEDPADDALFKEAAQ